MSPVTAANYYSIETSLKSVALMVGVLRMPGQITKRGGHFILGAHETVKLQGLMVLKQDGLTFAVALPKEAEGLDDVEINYA